MNDKQIIQLMYITLVDYCTEDWRANYNGAGCFRNPEEKYDNAIQTARDALGLPKMSSHEVISNYENVSDELGVDIMELVDF